MPNRRERASAESRMRRGIGSVLGSVARTPFVNRLPFGADLKDDIESQNPRICRGMAPRAQTLVCESRPRPGDGDAAWLRPGCSIARSLSSHDGLIMIYPV